MSPDPAADWTVPPVSPERLRVKSDSSTPVTDLLKTTVKWTGSALVGVESLRVTELTSGGVMVVRNSPEGAENHGPWG